MKNSQKAYFLEILKKYREEKASSEEIKFLEAYYNAFEMNEELITDQNEADYAYLKANIKSNINRKLGLPNGIVKNIYHKWLKLAGAAALILTLSLPFYLLITPKKKDLTAEIDRHIKPGSNKAILTLADGRQITLTDAGNGEIARQSGISITKTTDGQIVYTISGSGEDHTSKNSEPLKNTITTPRGGQYRVILPDGTNVLLNAASSLVYPAFFQGTERVVALNGEAYFEVTKNPNMPFKVESGGQTVEVLGTHFNISAYEDENVIRTTLLEGSVKVSSATASSVISPGEETILNRGKNDIIKHSVNAEKEIAWKNGMFSFENDDIKSVMRDIARWYDVEVSYKGDLSGIEFTGEIFRSAKLSEIYKILELNSIHFDVEGKKIIVSYDREAIKTNQP